MSQESTASDSQTAPAKINLALHVTGQRSDGFHFLDSLVVFAGDGDRVSACEAERDEIVITGHYAAHVPLGNGNLIARARDLLREAAGAQQAPAVRLTLEKNLPVAAGIGGGSSDAAAALRLLNNHWHLAIEDDALTALALPLGADLPMCLAARPLLARGIGDALETVEPFPSLPLVLVNPGMPLATPKVFHALTRRENPPLPPLPSGSNSAEDIAAWLTETRNDLEAPARALVPQIDDALDAVKEAGALLVRMSGSGATCFGLFGSIFMARRAQKQIGEAHPDWFVLATECGGATS